MPEFLRKGDHIGIVATARKISPEELKPAIEKIENYGLHAVLGKNLFLSDYQFAGNDDQRAEDLQYMLDHPEIKAILIARGGYGTARILPKLSVEKFKLSPKWIIGYSDITALHAFLYKETGHLSIHGIMPINFNSGNESQKSVSALFGILFGKLPEYTLPKHLYQSNGEAEGTLIGGNLSVLYSLNGTPFEVDFKDKILFIEDLDEYLYHIDRMMMNFKLSGKLAQLKGLIVGGMTNMHDNKEPYGKTAYKIIHDIVQEYTYPKIFNFPAGHEEPNMPLLLGKKIKMEVCDRQSNLYYR